jgi:GT2 family glycosyltransferase
MDSPEITIIVTSRERFSFSTESLHSLFAHTDLPYHLVYVDVNSPGAVAAELRSLARERDFTLVRVNQYVSPNHARNIGIRFAAGRYVVFVDNDVEYTDGWLDALVRCAEEEGAWVVGPLYLHGRLEDKSVHMAAGDMQFSGQWGTREFVQTQRHFMKHLDDVPSEELVRQKCDIIEFHCALVRREVLDRVGGMDEGLLTTREHLDFCQRVLDAGGTVYFEPASVVTYRMPPPFALTDLPYFMLRWSDKWTRETLTHFANKYGIKPSYVERVAKNRRSRQYLLFSAIKPRLHELVGQVGTQAAQRVFKVVEPMGNQVLVETLTRLRGPVRWEIVEAGSSSRRPTWHSA